MFDLIIRGGAIANHAGEARADIGVTAGKIAAIGNVARATAGADEVFDATGLHILAG